MAVPIRVTAMIPIATPNAVRIDLVRFAAICRAAIRKPSTHSAEFLIAFDDSILQPDYSPGMASDVLFVSDNNNRVATHIKVLQECHNLFASLCVEISGRL